MINVQQWLDDTAISEIDIVRVLSNRFGDGVVYLSKDIPRRVYTFAVNQGFISADGYITRKGRTLLAQKNIES